MDKNLTFLILTMICLLLLNGCQSISKNYYGEWTDNKCSYIILYENNKAFYYLTDSQNNKAIGVTDFKASTEKIIFDKNADEFFNGDFYALVSNDSMIITYNDYEIKLHKNNTPLYKDNDYKVSPLSYSDLILNGIDIESAFD